MKSSLFLSTRARAAFYGTKHLVDYFFHKEFRSPFRIAVDITNRCNLNCKTCYWRKETQRKELSDEQWERIIDKIVKKSPSIMQAAWLGGEPMLRFKLIRKLALRFPFNHIVTNGTVPIIPLKGFGYTVSIDGDKSDHEMQRGESYDKIKDNLKKTKAKNINILHVISSLNKNSTEDFIREWSEINSVSRIIFSFYSANLFQKKDPLWIDFAEQDKIIDHLSNLSRSYPKIKESVKHLQCFKGKHRKRGFNGTFLLLFLLQKFFN